MSQKITLRKTLLHFKTITHHKVEVAKGCFAVGLYRQGICHDLSKYSPTEFLEGARYYQGYRSPNNAEREDKGYSEAWLHHKGRNKHHYEYWIDYASRPEIATTINGLLPAKMPGRYVVEMLMDRIAASKTYKGDAYTDADPWKYYATGRTANYLHPETKALLEKLLLMLRDEGEEATFSYVRRHLYSREFGRRVYKDGRVESMK
ncbi:MAG: DUF5662 family protein [Lachnospiraceae bacterium]|jgi:hypothetical protein|nr:DUF5662 family protein [Lachnospiraceae bacterium]